MDDVNDTFFRRDSAAVSLAIGPLNTASQAAAWSESIGERGRQAHALQFDATLDRLLWRDRVNDGNVRTLPHYRFTPSPVRRFSFRRAAGSLDISHVLNESNVPFFSNPRTRRFADEIAVLADRGIVSAIVFHGSDARDPDLSMALSDHSFFRDAAPEWVDILRKRSARNRQTALLADVPLFVTTPDMLAHVPGSRMLPLTVNPNLWRTENRILEHRVPRVLHRPSGNGSPTKGTRHILPVLETLERQKRIEIVRSDVVSRDQMPRLLESADIVVDQLQSGAYGVTAIEALAAGRLVIADLSKDTRNIMGDVPIIDATPRSFSRTMNRVLGDLGAARLIAQSGPDYVARWHDGHAASRVLRRFLGG